MVKTLPSNTGCVCVIPGHRAKIPHASQPEDQNMKQKLCCNKLPEENQKSIVIYTKHIHKEFPCGPIVWTLNFHCQGPRFDNLVREIRPHKPHSVVKRACAHTHTHTHMILTQNC